MKRSILAALVSLSLAGCGGAADWATNKPVVVVHTRSAIFALEGDGAEQHKGDAENKFPAVCVDKDEDQDGVPDFMDPTPPASSGDQDKDACLKCDKPAAQWFLSEQNGGLVLRGGVVAQSSADSIVIVGPNGNLTFQISAATVIQHGPIDAGATVRVDATATGTAGTYAATRIEVQCAAPGSVATGDVPEGAKKVGDSDKSGTEEHHEGSSTGTGGGSGEHHEGSSTGTGGGSGENHEGSSTGTGGGSGENHEGSSTGTDAGSTENHEGSSTGTDAGSTENHEGSSTGTDAGSTENHEGSSTGTGSGSSTGTESGASGSADAGSSSGSSEPGHI